MNISLRYQLNTNKQNVLNANSEITVKGVHIAGTDLYIYTGGSNNIVFRVGKNPSYLYYEFRTDGFYMGGAKKF